MPKIDPLDYRDARLVMKCLLDRGLCRDSAGEIVLTRLAEWADEECGLSDNPDYVLPEWVFELAFAVAEEFDNAIQD